MVCSAIEWLDHRDELSTEWYRQSLSISTLLCELRIIDRIINCRLHVYYWFKRVFFLTNLCHLKMGSITARMARGNVALILRIDCRRVICSNLKKS